MNGKDKLMIHLRKATEEIMSKNWNAIEKRFLKYYQEILANNELIIKYRQKFYMTGYLRAYINVTQAKSKSPEFSIRYGGQEVALMRLDKKEEIFYLHFNEKKHAKNNKKFFGFDIKPGKYEWKYSPEAREFRKRFEKIPPSESPGIGEHWYESFILDELQNPKGDKFCGNYKYIRPVLIAGKIPFQMPVPIAARGGKPKYQKGPQAGHIDILARHGKSWPAPTVIELKRPGGQYDNALSQAFIYTVTLSYLIQKKDSDIGITLWRLCGYGGSIYSKVKFNSVVAIPAESKYLYDKELERLLPDIEGSNISLKYLIYRIVDNYKVDIVDTDLIA